MRHESKGKWLALAGALALALGLAWPARAEDGGRKACKEDVQKFCRGVKPGGGRIIGCLEDNESQLSAACKKRLEEGRQRGKKVRAACEADARRLCAGIAPGEGRIARCLHDHEKDVSQACQAAFRGSQSL